MKTNIKRAIRSLVYSLKNVKHYLKVVWKDRDWDYAYMEELMLVKFEKWYAKYEEDSCNGFGHVGIEKELQAMRICIAILKRRTENWYLTHWNQNSMITVQQLIQVEKRDWRIFCAILEKHFEKWWT